MEYNIINKEANEQSFLELFEECKGKVIITSDNAFTVSSVVKDLQSSSFANAGSLTLYNGVKCVMEYKDSAYTVIVVPTNVVRELCDYFKDLRDFYVAHMCPSEEDVFIFEFSIEQYINGVLEDDECASTESNTPRDTAVEGSDVNTEIVSGLYANNVVFIQDIDDKVIRLVKNEKDDVLVFKSIESFFKSHESSFWNNCTIILSFELEDGDDTDLYCRDVFSSLLKSGVTFVCNMSWIKLFLSVPAVDEDVNIKSVVIYNSKDFGPMGNTVLYTDAVSKNGNIGDDVVKIVTADNSKGV